MKKFRIDVYDQNDKKTIIESHIVECNDWTVEEYFKVCQSDLFSVDIDDYPFDVEEIL